jgi:hypothetical protein
MRGFIRVPKFDPCVRRCCRTIHLAAPSGAAFATPKLSMFARSQGMSMKPKTLVLFAVAATLGASASSFAQIPHLSLMPTDSATAIPIAATKADLAGAEKSAKAAQAAIGASRGDQAALVKAVRARNESQARSLLQKHGFSARQLEGAKIVFVDTTNGAEPQKTKVTIEASCCPLTITITIHL